MGRRKLVGGEELSWLRSPRAAHGAGKAAARRAGRRGAQPQVRALVLGLTLLTLPPAIGGVNPTWEGMAGQPAASWNSQQRTLIVPIKARFMMTVRRLDRSRRSSQLAGDVSPRRPQVNEESVDRSNSTGRRRKKKKKKTGSWGLGFYEARCGRILLGLTF